MKFRYPLLTLPVGLILTASAFRADESHDAGANPSAPAYQQPTSDTMVAHRAGAETG